MIGCVQSVAWEPRRYLEFPIHPIDYMMIYCYILWQPLKVRHFRSHVLKFEVISYSAAISACEKGNRSFGGGSAWKIQCAAMALYQLEVLITPFIECIIPFITS